MKIRLTLFFLWATHRGQMVYSMTLFPGFPEGVNNNMWCWRSNSVAVCKVNVLPNSFITLFIWFRV